MGKQKDFVAINMLTMYPNKASVCAVGMVKVKNGEVVDEFYSLVDPPEGLGLKGFNILKELHGITSDITAGAPTFIEILPKIEDFIEKLPLVVHNGVTERFVFIRALEYFRGTGADICSYLESVQFIDIKYMGVLHLVGKRYDPLYDARLCADTYIGMDVDDALYPKSKKRPEVTQQQVAYGKTKEKVSSFVFEPFDYSKIECSENIYKGFGSYITGNINIFKSKDELHLFLRDKLGVVPCKSHSKSRKDFILICGSTGAGPSKKDLAKSVGQIMFEEEELFDELISLGLEPPLK